MKKRTVAITLAGILLFIIAEPLRLLWQRHVLRVQGNTISHLESELKAQHFRIDPADFQAVAPTTNVAGWAPVRNAFHAYNEHLAPDTSNDTIAYDPQSSAYRLVQIHRAEQILAQENPWIDRLAKVMAGPNAIIAIDWPLGDFFTLNQPLAYSSAMRCLSTRALVEFEDQQPEKALADLRVVEATANRMIQCPVAEVCALGMRGNLSMYPAIKAGLVVNSNNRSFLNQLQNLVQAERMPNLETLIEGETTLSLQGLKLLMSDQASRIDTVFPRIHVDQNWNTKRLCQQKIIELLQSALKTATTIRQFSQNLPALQQPLTLNRSFSPGTSYPPSSRENFTDLINRQNTNVGAGVSSMLDALDRYIGTRRVESYAIQIADLHQRKGEWPSAVAPQQVDSWVLLPFFAMQYVKSGREAGIYATFSSSTNPNPSPAIDTSAAPEFSLTRQPTKFNFKGLSIPLPNL